MAGGGAPTARAPCSPFGINVLALLVVGTAVWLTATFTAISGCIDDGALPLRPGGPAASGLLSLPNRALRTVTSALGVSRRGGPSLEEMARSARAIIDLHGGKEEPTDEVSALAISLAKTLLEATSHVEGAAGGGKRAMRGGAAGASGADAEEEVTDEAEQRRQRRRKRAPTPTPSLIAEGTEGATVSGSFDPL
jgi:hypothetical protein